MMLSTPFPRLGRPLLLRFAVLMISIPIPEIMSLWLYCLPLCRMHITSLMLLSFVHGQLSAVFAQVQLKSSCPTM